jgi:putative restriction endonuclease
MTENVLITYYSNAILAIKCAHVAGKPVLAKPALLVATFDAIRKKKAMNNKLFYDNLKEAYSNVCLEYHIKETPMNYPFYFMASESFWNLHWNCEPIKTKAPSEKMLHDKVAYAFLDNALWDLLQDAGNRACLREAIVKHFFNDEQPESNDKIEEPATPRQLWALKLATGIDYRGRGLTKLEAIEMISKAKKEAEERGIESSSEEATPRQLRYLKRATGIDYSTSGLTKAKAIKMIRELKEEEDASTEPTSEEATYRQLRYLKRVTGIDYSNRGLTKRQASKMIQECIEGEDGEGLSSTREQGSTRTTQQAKQPDPEPGSLEDILSKCKTREEQLEAARRFFGEDK